LVSVYRIDGSLALARDEHLRPGTNLKQLSDLAPSFTKLNQPLDDEGTSYRGLMESKYPGLEINHIHHAGNSSGVVDGSAATLLASPQYARTHNLIPRAL